MPPPAIRPISPLTGVLDLRSVPDLLASNGLRMRQNFQTVGSGTLRRGSGFKKLLSVANYNNSDFHDQLLALSSAGGRQPVTLLYQAITTTQVRSLFVATQQTVAQLDAHSGGYRVLGTGFGGTFSTDALAPRFHAAQVGDFVAFTNDHDKPQYLRLDQAADPISGKYMLTFDDLDTIELSRAKVIWAWKNVLFLANVTMGQERAPYRIVWSDYNNPTQFDPANLQSITGFKDLFTYEEILAGKPVGNSFFIYTTHGIWEMIAVGGDQSFDFRRVYNGEEDERKACLAYANTLTNIHDLHSYVGREGIYFFGQYFTAPDRPEWLHRASFDFFANIDPDACDAHVSGVDADEVLYSIARKGASNHCPDYTLRINRKYEVADIVDHGFTTIAQFAPQDVPTIRDFIVENEICTISGLAGQGYPYGNQQLPRVLPAGSAPFTPDAIYTTIPLAVAGAGKNVEDYTQPHSSIHSLCALLGGLRIDEICRTCKPEPILIAASSVDWCIKQLGGVFYREMCQNPTAVGITDSNGYSAAFGSYTLDPITSILRFAPAFASDSLVKLTQLEIKFEPQEQNPPLQVVLRVGISAQPADPNTGVGIVFHQHSGQDIAYHTARNQAQHLAANTQPVERAHWHLYRVGRFLYIELTIAGVGGDAIFSSLEAELGSGGRTKNF